MTRLWPEEAERAVLTTVLGAACLDVEAGHRVVRRARAAGLGPEHFAVASHAHLWATIERLVDANAPVDPVSVAAELDRDHADPHVVGRLRVLACDVAPFGATERYVRIVVDAALRREIEERAA